MPTVFVAMKFISSLELQSGTSYPSYAIKELDLSSNVFIFKSSFASFGAKGYFYRVVSFEMV